MANTRQQSEYRRRDGSDSERKSKMWKIFGFLILFVLVFAAGVYVGHNHYFKIWGFASRTVRKPIEGAENLLKGASSSAWKEDLVSAINDKAREDIDPNEKKELTKEVEDACKTREKCIDPDKKVAVEQFWKQARELYDEARKDNRLDGQELRDVVAKLGEAAKAAE